MSIDIQAISATANCITVSIFLDLTSRIILLVAS